MVNNYFSSDGQQLLQQWWSTITSAVMVNNGNNINNMKTHLLSHSIEHKKTTTLKFQVLALNRHKNVAVLNGLIEF